MKRISYIVSPSGTITAIVADRGKSFLIAPDHPAYKDLRAAVYSDDAAKLEKLYDIRTAITAFGPGVTVQKDTVYYNGEPVHNMLTERILQYMRDQIDPKSLINFMTKLMQNPSKSSIDQLFAFLETNGLVIHEDGDFIGYKRVRADWKDFHSGTIDYRIGQKPFMLRNKVADEPGTACHAGLHVGSIGYASNFMTQHQGHVILVKVNPADAVSVPHMVGCDKLRVCKLEVIAEYGETTRITKPVYEEKLATCTVR